MATRTTTNGTFRLSRPGVAGGPRETPDDHVLRVLAEMDEILGRRHWPAQGDVVVETVDVDGDDRPDFMMVGDGLGSDIAQALGRTLAPRKVEPSRDRWRDDSLLDHLSGRNTDKSLRTLGEVINLVPELANLKFQYERHLRECWTTDFSYNQRTVLAETLPNIRNYLLARAYFVDGATSTITVQGAIEAVGSGSLAVLEDYTKLSAARLWMDASKLEVDRINDPDSSITKSIRAADVSFSASTFAGRVEQIVRNDVFNGDEIRLIRKHLGDLPHPTMNAMVAAVRSFEVPENADIAEFLPGLLLQVTSASTLTDASNQALTLTTPDTSADVAFLATDASTADIDQASVRFAAQLYYTMVLGDELQIFDSINYLTHKLLLNQSVPLADPLLRQDLQDYVFSDKFRVQRATGWEYADRSRPAERAMFYRQVFGSKSAAGGDRAARSDANRNQAYARLWKVLILESAKYLERASISPTAGTYVSRQSIQQAVEDLQYNLSYHCTGMATVASPLLYEELQFVTQRILTHPEIIRWLAPQGGSWWRAIEQIHLAMNGRRPQAKVLNSKGEFGYNILRSIADYDPATFVQDSIFSEFLSNVDAFIITQSILQDALEDDLKSYDDATDVGGPSMDGTADPAMAGAGAPAASDDGWDF